MAKPIIDPKDSFDQWRVKTNQISDNIGDLDLLATTDKTSLVNAVNEVKTEFSGVEASVGDLTNLQTTDKTSLVNAINEVYLGNETLLNNEVARIEDEFDAAILVLEGNVTTVSNKVGDIATLTTTDKSSAVNAINEITQRLLANYSLSEVNDQVTTDAGVIDVFLYDATQDSDMGQWRNRTQSTSWYNETLNTATRGATREFPSLALFALKATSLIIYDLTDPTCPMWKVYDLTGYTARKIHVLNNKVCIATSTGLWTYNFLDEVTFVYNAGSTPALPSISCFDVSMTVFPSSEVDVATEMQVPHIAVVTNSLKGCYLITDSESVYGIGPTSSFVSVNFNKQSLSAVTSSGVLYTWKNALLIDSNDFLYDYSLSTSTSPKLLAASNNAITEKAISGDNGLVLLKEFDPPLNESDAFCIDYVTIDYTSGWMYKDIKGAFLADTVAETITNANTEYDRSTISTNLSVVGTLTKSSAGTTTELVKYSGFSNGVNYLTGTHANFVDSLFCYGWQYNGSAWVFVSGPVNLLPINGVSISNNILTIAGTYPKALIRFTADTPEPATLAFIEASEASLFVTNAKCTIQGASSDVVDIDYDKITNIISCGTSDGVTEFQGLVATGYRHTGESVQALSTNNKRKATKVTAGTYAFLPAVEFIDKFNDATAALVVAETKEDDLGLPSEAGMVLTSSVGGVRSWVAPPTSPDVSDLITNIGNLQNDIDTVETSIDLIESSITVLNSEINTLNAKAPYFMNYAINLGQQYAGLTVVLNAAMYETFMFICPNGALTINPVNFGIGRTINILLSNGGNCSLTWPAGTVWPGGSAPILTASSNYDKIVLQKISDSTIQAFVSGLNFS